MTTDARAALDRLVAALEKHLGAVQQRRGEQDPAVEDAYSVLADAFEAYDEALFDNYQETTPFELFDDTDEDDDDADDDADDDDDDADDDDADDDEADLEPDDEDDVLNDDEVDPATRL